mgnify:CR=1 FL=1
MAVYMYQGVYSKDSISALVENPQDRTSAINAVVEANGGKLIGCWMAFGEYDLLVIAEMPNDESMAGVALAVGAVGTASGGKTTKLLTMDQAVKAMANAQGVVTKYRPPSS